MSFIHLDSDHLGPTNCSVNDSHFRRAISYLDDEGADDSSELFLERVQQIKNVLIDRYREEGYAYDRQLYHKLRSMVEEVSSDLMRLAQEESNVDVTMSDPSDTSDGSMENLGPRVAALHRGTFGSITSLTQVSPEATRAFPSSTSIVTGKGIIQLKGHSPSTVPHNTKLPTIMPPTLPSDTRKDKYQRKWVYGGPHNEKEVWHHQQPAILPFGETPYMRQWNSMQIHNDLNRYKKRRHDNENPFTQSTIPYEWVDPARLPKPHDSGSRFKLPELTPYKSAVDAVLGLDWNFPHKDWNDPPKLSGHTKHILPRIFLDELPFAIAETSTYMSPMASQGKDQTPKNKQSSVGKFQPTMPMSEKKKGKQPVVQRQTFSPKLGRDQQEIDNQLAADERLSQLQSTKKTSKGVRTPAEIQAKATNLVDNANKQSVKSLDPRLGLVTEDECFDNMSDSDGLEVYNMTSDDSHADSVAHGQKTSKRAPRNYEEMSKEVVESIESLSRRKVEFAEAESKSVVEQTYKTVSRKSLPAKRPSRSYTKSLSNKATNHGRRGTSADSSNVESSAGRSLRSRHINS